MKLGILSDIHNNRALLARAFELGEQVDQWLCLGDVINQFMFSSEVVAMVRDRCSLTIQGNHEELFFANASACAGADGELRAWLASRPSQASISVGGRHIEMVHSTPWQPRGDYVYPSSGAFQRLGESTGDVLLYGHTHQPVVARVNGTLVVNPGSIGEGRPGTDGYICSFAVLDLASLTAEIVDL